MKEFAERDLGFTSSHDKPIRYIDRTHRWYKALGYGEGYRYAQYANVPFAPLRKPLSDCQIALLTTAARFQHNKGAQDAKAPYNASAKFYSAYSGDTEEEHDLRVSHVGVDRAHLTDDSNCWFPLAALKRVAASGRIKGLTKRFHGVPTNRSQRHTIDIDAPELLKRCIEDKTDAAVLVANCPVCHQSMSLTARALESEGIPTIIMGAAKDIVELCGVPRFLFSDFPLGNAAGRPYDIASQDQTLAMALTLLEDAFAPRTTVQNPLHWDGSAAWHVDYLNLDHLSSEEIAEIRAKNDAVKQKAQTVRDETLAQENM